jgi:hypothetical protein
MSTNSQDEVIARYGRLYRGDDELAANCLIQRDGRCVRLFQGLAVVSVTAERAPRGLHEKLLELLDDPIPPDWPNSSYAGYNFITSPEEASGAEIAVFGQRAGEIAGYYAAPPDSEVAALVRRIAALEPLPAGAGEATATP